MSVTFADGREVHDAPDKARHVCERPRGGERAVSCERPASSRQTLSFWAPRERRWRTFSTAA